MPLKNFERYNQAGQVVETGIIFVSQEQANAESIHAGLRTKLQQLQSVRADWANVTTVAALRTVVRLILTVVIWLLRQQLADYADAEDA